MELLHPHHCPRCGQNYEARLIIAGPHIKQVCARCLFYVKFISIFDLPPLLAVRQATWALAGKSIEIIDAAKKDTGFGENCGDQITEYVDYWKLYLHLFETVHGVPKTKYLDKDDTAGTEGIPG